MLPVKKIYVDSRFRTNDSVSSSNFKFQLPESLLMPENCTFSITDVCIPHSWYTLEFNVNDMLYWHLKDIQANFHYMYQTSLDSRNYSGTELATEIQLRMNNQLTASNITTFTFTATFSLSTQKITITPTTSTHTFSLLTKADIQAKMSQGLNWSGPAYDITNPMDINSEILKLNVGLGGVNSSILPFVGNHIDLQPIKNVYISSPNLGNFNAVTHRGFTSLIKKVPVSVNFNFMIVDAGSPANDYLNCSKQTLRSLEFLLRDDNNRIINMHNQDVSFSVVFTIMNPV